jgi:hypothetical protein
MAEPPPPAIKPLGRAVLGTGLTDIVVAPSAAPNSISEIFVIWVANTDTAVRTVSLRTGSGALVSPGNSLGEGWAIPANTTFEIDGSSSHVCVLKQGEKLQGLCDVANKVTVSCYGQETSN